jgi:hypothetical protein
MPGRAEGLGIFLLLLPGFFTALIVQRLAVRARQSELDKIVEAVTFSFLLYLLTLPFFGYTLPVSWTAVSHQSFTEYLIQLRWEQLAALFAAAVAFGVLQAANINHDWLLRLLRRSHVTERTARTSIWNDAFQDIPGRYVMVSFSDGRSILGYVRYYADESEDGALFLEDAAWVDQDGTQFQIQGPGILITKSAGLEFVTFLDPAPVAEPESSQKPTLEWSRTSSTRPI